MNVRNVTVCVCVCVHVQLLLEWSAVDVVHDTPLVTSATSRSTATLTAPPIIINTDAAAAAAAADNDQHLAACTAGR